MTKEIIINASSSQTRVAITEEGRLVDFFVDFPEKERMVGNIYLGKVARVLPGIRAAFIDIGMKHDAFLHFSDIGENVFSQLDFLDDDDDELENENGEKPKKKNLKVNAVPKLNKGQDILVQILKEPVKDKGVRVTSSISIPGRFCVLLPFDNQIGVSKKISDYKERKRLKKIARSIIPENYGLIIRTAARNQDENLLRADLQYLKDTWTGMEESVKNLKPPSLVYKDVSTTVSVIRDLFSNDISKVFIDSKKIYKEIKHYVQFVQPLLVERIEYYKGSRSIFVQYDVEEQIRSIMQKRVFLPSGGHIVIELTEAMIVIDVNSGKYAAKKEQELNSLKTDLEAAREIVRQLRLRDIGGLIVVDFIDLEDDRNRKKVYDELRKEFRKDRAKTAMLPMTDFGLMQITRQRVRENIIQSMYEPCTYCEGTGLLMKKSNLIHEIEEWLKRYKLEGKQRKLILQVHPELSKKLKEGSISLITKMKFRYMLNIKLEVSEKLDSSSFMVLSAKTGEDLTEEFS